MEWCSLLCHSLREIADTREAIKLDANMILIALIFVLFYGHNHILGLHISDACSFLKL